MVYHRKETAMNVNSLAQKRALIKSDTVVVGIDVAKFHHVARALLPDGSISRICRFANSREGFLTFAAQLETWKPSPAAPVIIGLESTSCYWVNLARWLTESGCRVVQVCGLHVCRAKELLDNCRGTSDGKDALLIADLVAQGKYLGLVQPTGVLADLRQLVGLRQRLVGERTARCNLLHQSVYLLFPEFASVFHDVTGVSARRVLRRFPTPRAVLAQSSVAMRDRLKQDGAGRVGIVRLKRLHAAAEQSIGSREGAQGAEYALADTLLALESLGVRLQQLEDEIDRLLGQVDETPILTSVLGVGRMTAAAILGETGGLRQYSCAAAVLKLAGLNLYQISSGLFRGKRRVSKRGRPLLRQVLYLAALQHTRPGTLLYPQYVALVKRGKPKQVALVAIACRLLRLLYALVRDGRACGSRPPENGQGIRAA
jgi:transposase